MREAAAAAGLLNRVNPISASVVGPINDLIDEAYPVKYHGSPYLGPMLSSRARSTTVKVTPRDRNA